MKVESSEKHLLINETEFKDFSPGDFEVLSSKYGKKTVVLHGENLKDSLDEIKANFKDNYFVQLGVTASKNDITNLENKNSEYLLEKVYKNTDEALEDIKVSYSKGRNLEWFKYIPELIHDENLNYLQKELNLSRLLTLKDSSNEVIAMIMTFDSDFFTDEPIDQVGWVWIKDDITKELRFEAHSKISKWLKKNLTKNFYQAGIHIENSRSQKFFQKMGFEVKCAHITKK